MINQILEIKMKSNAVMNATGSQFLILLVGISNIFVFFQNIITKYLI